MNDACRCSCWPWVVFRSKFVPNSSNSHFLWHLLFLPYPFSPPILFPHWSTCSSTANYIMGWYSEANKNINNDWMIMRSSSPQCTPLLSDQKNIIWAITPKVTQNSICWKVIISMFQQWLVHEITMWHKMINFLEGEFCLEISVTFQSPEI